MEPTTVGYWYLQAKGSDPAYLLSAQPRLGANHEDRDTHDHRGQGEKRSFRLSKEKDEDFKRVGIGGVWNYQSKKNGQSLIPELDQVDWLGRLVIIIFDADRMLTLTWPRPSAGW